MLTLPFSVLSPRLRLSLCLIRCFFKALLEAFFLSFRASLKLPPLCGHLQLVFAPPSLLILIQNLPFRFAPLQRRLFRRKEFAGKISPLRKRSVNNRDANATLGKITRVNRFLRFSNVQLNPNKKFVDRAGRG